METCSHSFFNDRSRAYDSAASEDSWRRPLAFFERGTWNDLINS
jgi:dienelactone hydrolase